VASDAGATHRKGVEEFNPFWFEDPVKMDHLSSLKEFSREYQVPIATGETLGGIGQYRELLEMEAIGIAIMDLSWCGGFTAARKVAAMGESCMFRSHFTIAPGPSASPHPFTWPSQHRTVSFRRSSGLSTTTGMRHSHPASAFEQGHYRGASRSRPWHLTPAGCEDAACGARATF
jgi:hypothetical protein